MSSNDPPSVMYKELMKPDEDWTSLPNSAERRRIQNRIAQRAYRRNMRERTDEVQRLKARVRELECTERDGTTFNASVDTSPSTSPNAMGTFGQDSEFNSQKACGSGSDLTGYASTNWTHPPEQEAMFAMKPLPIPKAAHDLDPLAEFSSCCVYTEPTSGTSCSSKQQITSAPQRGPPPMSTAQSGRDQFQQKRIQASFRRRFHQVRVANFTLGLRKPQQLLSRMASFPTGNATQHFSPTQPVTTSIMNDSNIFRWPGTESKPVQGFGAVEIPSSSSVKPDYNDSSPPQSNAHAHSSLLHLAVASGNADTLRLLLRNLQVSTIKRDAAGYTPLERAVLRGRTDLVAILLDYGIDVGSEDEIAELSKVTELGNTGSVS